MDLKVKEFAAQQGVSESIIYRHIRQHREELGGNIIKKAKATWITDAGQAYLCSLMVEAPIVVSEAADRQEIERLRSEIDGLKDKLIDRFEETEALRKEVAVLSEAKLQLEAHDARREVALQEAKNEAGEALNRLAEVQEALARAEKERDDARGHLAEALAQNEALKRRGLRGLFAWIQQRGK